MGAIGDELRTVEFEPLPEPARAPIERTRPEPPATRDVPPGLQPVPVPAGARARRTHRSAPPQVPA